LGAEAGYRRLSGFGACRRPSQCLGRGDCVSGEVGRAGRNIACLRGRDCGAAYAGDDAGDGDVFFDYGSRFGGGRVGCLDGNCVG